MSARLFCPTPLRGGEVIDLPSAAAHHASRVLR
jgi:16S rRNA U1498 N3-methylase RsmE